MVVPELEKKKQKEIEDIITIMKQLTPVDINLLNRDANTLLTRQILFGQGKRKTKRSG